ncbi:MAG: hypothetical protein GEV12_02530 [Micromonosporaceae bacterium]|nr:hypothetical protein [Micromonosporaceae bacterium]
MGTVRNGGPHGTGGQVPRSGDVLQVTRDASVQFATPILFRVIRVHDWPTYTGWVWLDGYQLNAAGDAVKRRSIFVQTDGIRTVSAPPWSRPARADDPGAPAPG